jgi:hypothetical protein
MKVSKYIQKLADKYGLDVKAYREEYEKGRYVKKYKFYNGFLYDFGCVAYEARERGYEIDHSGPAILYFAGRQ